MKKMRMSGAKGRGGGGNERGIALWEWGKKTMAMLGKKRLGRRLSDCETETLIKNMPLDLEMEGLRRQEILLMMHCIALHCIALHCNTDVNPEFVTF